MIQRNHSTQQLNNARMSDLRRPSPRPRPPFSVAFDRIGPAFQQDFRDSLIRGQRVMLHAGICSDARNALDARNERTYFLSARAGDHRPIERPRASDFDLSDFDLGIELRPALQWNESLISLLAAISSPAPEN
jgi:hypothetical protein